MKRHFIYEAAKGDVTTREVLVRSETDTSFTGVCLAARAIRTFRKDRVLAYLDDPAAEAARVAARAHIPPAPVSDLQVCFTGFGARDKARLTALAIERGLVVRASVTAQLNFLCTGARAGLTKRDQALQVGAALLTEEEFIAFLETGEIPDDSDWLLAPIEEPLPPVALDAPAAAPGRGPYPIPAPGSAPVPVDWRRAVPAWSQITAPRVVDAIYVLVLLVALFGGVVVIPPPAGPPFADWVLLGWLVLTYLMVWRSNRALHGRGQPLWLRCLLAPVAGVVLGLVPLFILAIRSLPPVSG